MLCVCVLVPVLNDTKNYVQQGCAMQFSGITLKRLQKLIAHHLYNFNNIVVTLEVLSELHEEEGFRLYIT